MSSEPHRLAVENAWVVRTPPGAAWKSSRAASVARPLRMSQSPSHWSRLGEWVACTFRFNSPARSSSPRMAGMPPARWTSSMWYLGELGATFDRHGTLREMRSMSPTWKSCSASRAAASRCSTVLVDPPMATSRATAFSKAAMVATLRGRTDSSSSW